MSDKEYEAIVIGAGPGGYVAAIRLGQLGIKTLCVEKEYLGGVCLNWGCIPSKALIAATSLLEKIRSASEMGITVSDLSIDVAAMQAWKEGIVKKLTGGVRTLIKGNGGDIQMGDARLVSAQEVEVRAADGTVETYRASRGIVLATGAEVIRVPGFEPDGETVLTAREAVSLTEAPASMLIIGGGVIGLELGMVYQKLGTKVTIVEMLDQILPGVDEDLVRVVQKHLKKAGAEVLTKARALSMSVEGGKARVTIEQGGKERTIECEKVLVAVGFSPRSKGIGLEELGVELDGRGHIQVDEKLATNVPGLYAIGDVRGGPYLAHKASKEGEIAAEVIAGHAAAVDWHGMPAAIFTEPEIATVGMSEAEAKRLGRDVKVGKFPYAALGRAMAVRETDGFFKAIVDAESHQLLGVGIVGSEASNLISEAALAVEMCAFAEDVALTIHPHPTLGEGLMEAFKNALGEAIHVVNKAPKRG